MTPLRNGESLRSIRGKVTRLSPQIGDSAEVDLRAVSLDAIVIGQAKADKSLSWALRCEKGGGGV